MTEVRDVIAKTPGILQSDIYTSLSVSKENVGYSLRVGDEAGLIKRTKKGRSYQLWNNP
jgi:predicted transcriptional regulator